MGGEEQESPLLQYYKKRVDDFEVERQDLLARIQLCQSSAAENYSLRIETQKRTDEVRELQQALSAAHIHLFEERDRLLQLQAENDALRLQEVENQRRLQHLCCMTSSAESQICPTSYRKQDMAGICYPLRNKDGDERGSSDAHGTHAPKATNTINTDALSLKIESLQAQLAEQRQLASEQVEALKQDRSLRQQDEEAHRRNYQRQIEELTTKVKRTEEALRSATTDYILTRRDKQASDARAVAAEALLDQERQKAAADLIRQQAADRERFESAQLMHQEELENRTSQLTKSLKKREIEYSQLESMHLSVKGELEQRVEELEDKLIKVKEKLRQAEKRRNMDQEGFTNDVCLLRKQLSAVDRKLHQMRLQSRLEDDERLHSLLQKLEKRGGRQDDQNWCELNVPRSTAGAVESLGVIKRNIAQLERRAQMEAIKPSH